MTGLKLKVLPPYRCYELSNSHANERTEYELANYYTEIPPVFNRDGRYLQGENCWFEVRDKAYLDDKVMFMYELKRLNILEKDIALYRLLKPIYRLNRSFLTREQIEFMVMHEDEMQYRQQRRESRKRLREFKKRVRDYRLRIKGEEL